MTKSDLLFYTYGYAPFVKILNHYEQLEEFEICASMIDTINRINKREKFEFKTKWSEENTINELIESGVLKDIDSYLERFDYYVSMGKQFAEQHRDKLILNL